MSVFEFVEHLSAQVKEFEAAHLAGHTRPVTAVDLIPVDVLLLEEAIMLIYNRPECVKVADNVLIPLLDLMTRGEQRQHTGQYYCRDRFSHYR